MSKRTWESDVVESDELTEFEKRRLENIRKNQEILRQLALDAGESLFLSTKTRSTPLKANKKNSSVSKGNATSLSVNSKQNHENKKNAETPVPQRRSLRLSGAQAVDYSKENVISGLGSEFVQQPDHTERFRDGPLSLTLESGEDTDLQAKFIADIKNASDWHIWEKNSGLKEEDNKSQVIASLEDQHMAKELSKLSVKYSDEPVKVVKDRILSCTWHPSPSNLIVTVGDKFGRLGFWHVDSSLEEVKKEVQEKKITESLQGEEEDDEQRSYEVFTFKPHDGGVSTVQYDTLDSSKLYTCSYDGTVRLMDVSQQKFDQVYLCEDRYMVCAFDHYENSLYFTKSSGEFIHLDTRTKKSTVTQISEKKVHSAQICPTDSTKITTSGIDRTWNIWDVRKMDEAIVTFEHGKSCTSAYWSPCGRRLVSTSFDDSLQMFEDVFQQDWDGKSKFKIRHNNQTGRWVTNFRAIFHRQINKPMFFVANMDRFVDIYSANSGRLLHQLYDPNYVTAIPSVLSIHPNVQETLLVTANASGKCLIWR